MRLRKLELKDKNGMLEWIKCPEINRYFQFNPETINLDSLTEFIKQSHHDPNNKHYAIVNNEDEYLGTISLKNIDCKNGNAEYAISLRKEAIGKGISQTATDRIMRIAFLELSLHKIYLNVISENIRAIRFYEKYGFTFEGEFTEQINSKGEYKNLRWYAMFKKQFMERFQDKVDIIN
ncbi:MAG: GNAT family N-acetyltransferase [Peptococcaceae bacterium]|nr:GNAT family N-acetyltransferase [Peptococcaceae bacterium]